VHPYIIIIIYILMGWYIVVGINIGHVIIIGIVISYGAPGRLAANVYA
jgi:hypothetical protein